LAARLVSEPAEKERAGYEATPMHLKHSVASTNACADLAYSNLYRAPEESGNGKIYVGQAKSAL